VTARVSIWFDESWIACALCLVAVLVAHNRADRERIATRQASAAEAQREQARLIRHNQLRNHREAKLRADLREAKGQPLKERVVQGQDKRGGLVLPNVGKVNGLSGPDFLFNRHHRERRSADHNGPQPDKRRGSDG
jgi:hypothetical protein